MQLLKADITAEVKKRVKPITLQAMIAYVKADKPPLWGQT